MLALTADRDGVLWIATVVSNTGTWMQSVAQSWHIYKMTGNDPLYLGWLGLAFAVPMVVLPPLGGVVVEHRSAFRTAALRAPKSAGNRRSGSRASTKLTAVWLVKTSQS